MEISEKKHIIKHFERIFKQKCKSFLSQQGDYEVDIDVMLFEPNKKFPFWKMVTLGASDYQMPSNQSDFADRNEYMLFFDKFTIVSEDRTDWHWYYEFLMRTATYAYFNKCRITYGNSIDINTREKTDMEAAYIIVPLILKNSKAYTCRITKNKLCNCFQVLPITEDELKEKIKLGSEKFLNNYILQNEKILFLAEKLRK